MYTKVLNKAYEQGISVSQYLANCLSESVEPKLDVPDGPTTAQMDALSSDLAKANAQASKSSQMYSEAIDANTVLEEQVNDLKGEIRTLRRQLGESLEGNLSFQNYIWFVQSLEDEFFQYENHDKSSRYYSLKRRYFIDGF